MPRPRDLKRPRSLLGGLSYYRKFLPNMANRVRPIPLLLKQGDKKNVFTPAMEAIVRDLLTELSAPPTPFFFSTGMLSQIPVARFAFIVTLVSMASLPLSSKSSQMARFGQSCILAAQNWSQSGIGPPSIFKQEVLFGACNFSAVICGHHIFFTFSDRKALEKFGKVGEHNPRVQRGLEFATGYECTLEY